MCRFPKQIEGDGVYTCPPVCLWRVGALAQYVCACALRATLALLSPGEGSTLLA